MRPHPGPSLAAEPLALRGFPRGRRRRVRLQPLRDALGPVPPPLPRCHHTNVLPPSPRSIPSRPVSRGAGAAEAGGGGRSSVPRGGGTAPAPPALVRPTAEFAPLCPARSQRRPPGLYLKLRRPNKSSQASHRGLSLLGGGSPLCWCHPHPPPPVHLVPRDLNCTPRLGSPGMGEMLQARASPPCHGMAEGGGSSMGGCSSQASTPSKEQGRLILPQ